MRIVPDLEEVRRVRGVTDTQTEWDVRILVEDETSEKEYYICLKSEEVGKLLSLVPYGHRHVCSDCSVFVVGHTVCQTEDRHAIRVFD